MDTTLCATNLVTKQLSFPIKYMQKLVDSTFKHHDSEVGNAKSYFMWGNQNSGTFWYGIPLLLPNTSKILAAKRCHMDR